jgi:hypothetical protein
MTVNIEFKNHLDQLSIIIKEYVKALKREPGSRLSSCYIVHTIYDIEYYIYYYKEHIRVDYEKREDDLEGIPVTLRIHLASRLPELLQLARDNNDLLHKQLIELIPELEQGLAWNSQT